MSTGPDVERLTDERRPDASILSLLIVVEYHARTGGTNVDEGVWKALRLDVEDAHKERQELLMAYEDRQHLLALIEHQQKRLEELEALDQAVTYIRNLYPESVFRRDSESIDANSAKMARLTCDNIRREAQRRLEEGEHR